MIPVEDAHRLVRERTGAPLPGSWVSLLDLLGRVLAEDVIAPADLPPFDSSAMDGYAVQAADVTVPGSSLAILGEVAAGQVWSGAPLRRGEAVRIMTGAPIPPGATAVVPVEDARELEGRVIVLAPGRSGDHVRPAGNDVPAGCRVLRCGDVLTPARIGLLAALGRSGASVVNQARVAIMCTGEELLDPLEAAAGSPETAGREIREGASARADRTARALAPGQIWNSNAYGLQAQVLESGARPWYLGVCPDDLDQTRDRLRRALDQADVLVTTGGVSMGRHDHVGQALAELGEVLFTSVAQQPGKPLTFAVVRGKPVFALPGNPVSAALSFDLYVRPALRRMMGHQGGDRPRFWLSLAEPLSKRPGRAFYVRARFEGAVARPTGAQGSARWQSLADADGVLLIPEDAGDLPAGTEVEAIRL